MVVEYAPLRVRNEQVAVCIDEVWIRGVCTWPRHIRHRIRIENVDVCVQDDGCIALGRDKVPSMLSLRTFRRDPRTDVYAKKTDNKDTRKRRTQNPVPSTNRSHHQRRHPAHIQEHVCILSA